MKLMIIALAATLLLSGERKSATTLPVPYATPSAKNGPKVIPRPDGATLHVPSGFTVTEFASGLERPRFMVQGTAGEILVSDTVPNGAVYLLEGSKKTAVISGLDKPYGLAFWHEYLYVGEPTSIKRYKYDSATHIAGAGEEVVSLAGYDKGHVTRTITFSKSGDKMYVAVGSSGDLVEGDPENRAAINEYNPDGTGHRVYATGFRNPVGLRVQPDTGDLWTTVEERNDLGDGLVADYFTSVKPGGFYGWPYAYLGPNEDPRLAGKHPDLVKTALAPDVVLEPHCAILDFVFYTGKAFPAKYRGGAFLANHGSSNRAERVGYSLSFLPFHNGKPVGKPRDFLTGWMLAADQKDVWGRPVGLLELRDGSLLVSDDGGKKIWRIAYGK
jgi:glucose/arabinose dehydrogenase